MPPRRGYTNDRLLSLWGSPKTRNDLAINSRVARLLPALATAMQMEYLATHFQSGFAVRDNLLDCYRKGRIVVLGIHHASGAKVD